MPASRRGKGDGLVRKRADGRWEARLELPRGENGKRRHQFFYGATRREVTEKIRQAQRQLDEGVEVETSKQTVRQYLSYWLEEVARPSVRERTYLYYESYCRLYLLPDLGHIPIGKLSAQQIQTTLNLLLKRVSSRTVHHTFVVLKTALRHAVKIRVLVRNPLDVVEPPKVSRYQVRVLSEQQAQRFVEAAREHRLYALFLLAVATGARQGELFARKWGDIDWQRGTLQITTTLVRRKGPWRLEEPKSERSRRSLALPPVVLEALKEHRERQQFERLMASRAWEDNGLIFCTTVGTPLRQTDVRVRGLLPILEKAELPVIRFHDLRHTAATLLLAAGEHPKVVPELLGHSTIATTLDIYSHVTESMQRSVAAKMQKLLGGQIGGQETPETVT